MIDNIMMQHGRCSWPCLSIFLSSILCAACGANGINGETQELDPSFCISRQMTDDRHFGCATRYNMAAQAANPDDLIGPRSERPRDSTRRDAVLKTYADGLPSKSQNENTASSNPSTDNKN